MHKSGLSYFRPEDIDALTAGKRIEILRKDSVWTFRQKNISARIVKRRKNDHHPKLWRHDNERDGGSQDGGGGNQHYTGGT
jgi:ATP sulfurylase